MASELKFPEFPKENALGGRVSHLIATGGVPGALIALVGDFTSPKGGWMVVGACGLASLVALACAFAYLANRDPSAPAPWIYQKVTRQEQLSWVWSGRPVFTAHGLHVLLVFSIVCFFCASKSFANVASGGVLGKHLDAVAAAQKMLGIAQQQLEATRETNRQLQTLNTTASSLKLETSENPRKELGNLNVPYNDQGFAQAVHENNLKVVSLFVQTGFRPMYVNGRIPRDLLESGTADLQALVTPLLPQLGTQDCYRLFETPPLKTSAPSKEALGVLRAACSNQVETLRLNIAGHQQWLDDHQRNLKAFKARSAAEAERARAQFKDCLRMGMGRACSDPDEPPKTSMTDDYVRRERQILSWLN